MSRPLPPPKRKLPKKTKSINGPVEMWDRLERLAAEQDRSLADLVGSILQDRLDEYDGKKRR